LKLSGMCFLGGGTNAHTNNLRMHTRIYTHIHTDVHTLSFSDRIWILFNFCLLFNGRACIHTHTLKYTHKCTQAWR
jgi:hypothetical protein